MSLLDTIDAARQEATAAADGRTIKEKPEVSNADAPAYDPMSLGKRTAANGKLATEAGASVRTAAKKSNQALGTMSKEERKAEKRRRREEEDLRSRAYDIILRADEGYKKTERMWWILLGIGFSCTVVSLIAAYALNDGTGSTAAVSVIALVLAYVFIIAGFVYDIWKRRPFRKAAEKRVAGMTNKRVADLLEADRQERLAEEAKKAAAKAEKNAAKK